MGGPGIAVAEAAGGGGGEMLDAALVAEQHGRRLAPVPLIEASVAAKVLGRCGSVAALRQLAGVLQDAQVATVAMRPARAGVAAMVPWAAVADAVIVLQDDRLLLVVPSPGTIGRPGMGAEAPGDVVIGDAASVIQLASGSAAVQLAGQASDEWRILKAAALVGLAAEAVALALAYAKERHQFGRPIGSFQALAHGLVDVATAVDGARLLAYEAAWSAGEHVGGAQRLAPMAFAFAADTAMKATARALHCHGGYGFTEAYDIQLYYRRARSWSLVGGTVRGELLHLASVLWPSDVAGHQGEDA